MIERAGFLGNLTSGPTRHYLLTKAFVKQLKAWRG
jgi:hypothetical protein